MDVTFWEKSSGSSACERWQRNIFVGRVLKYQLINWCDFILSLPKKIYIIATLFFITSNQRGNPFTTARFVDLAERFSLGRCYPLGEDSKNSPEHASLSRNRFED